ncbi:MAG TPA: hypothetical protein VGG74_05350 [Kofleriaceae bacterium]|jgi:hypothetical protein
MRLLVVVAAVTACRGGDARPRLDLSKGFTVRLTFGGGAEPFYDTVAIGDDGRVERTVHESASVQRSTGTIEPAEVATLRALLETNAFATVPRDIGRPVADGPTVDLEVETPTGLRVVHCAGTCRSPRPLDAVATAIVDIRDRLPAPPTSPPRPRMLCSFIGALERIDVDDHHLTRISSGINHTRDVEIEPVPTGSGGIDLIFVAYAADDYPPIANWRGPDKPREHLVAHTSVVAHLAMVGGERRIDERAVDLHTGMQFQPRDHSYPCALIDATYVAAHPAQFVK